MNELFEISIEAVSEDPDIDFEAIAGQRMTFRIRKDTSEHGGRTWTGLCRHIEQVSVEERGLSVYRLVLVPALWLLTQRKNQRMFQRESEVDIARKLLAEWRIAFAESLTGTYGKREYRVQYGETDFTFLRRMLEDAGVALHFRTEGDETQVVLSDAPQRNTRREPPIAFRDNPTTAAREHVTHVHVGRTIRPGKYTVRDHDHRRSPSFDFKGSTGAVDGVEGLLEQFEYSPGAFVFESEKARGEAPSTGDDRGCFRSDDRFAAVLAERKLSAGRTSARTVTFETNTLDLAPGSVVSFVDHPRSELSPGKGLLITRLSLSGESNGAWKCTCEAVSADTAYHPPAVTPRPKASGVESATVVGPDGEEIHTDELGRVRVHFHWDRESRMNERSSCWIHMSQPWGGSGFGGTTVARIGQEVIVDFLGGDPDRPVIVGRLYTALQTTPYKLPDNKTQSGLRSRSSPGGDGDNYNELMFEDRKGQELLRLQAEKDLHKLVKNDENVTIGRDRTKLVKNDDTLTVDNDRTKLVKNDENVTIGNDRVKLVKNDESVTIGRDRTKVVENDEQSTIGNNRTKLVKNDESVTIGNDRSKLVKNDEHVTIGNDRSKLVKNDEHVTIGNDRIKRVKNDEHVTIGKNLVRTVMANARDVTGISKSVVVGVSRATQVGMIDSTIVGQSHSVMVSPPGEGGLAATTSCVIVDNKITTTTRGGAFIQIEGKKITLSTGAGAELVLDGDEIRLSAKNIHADAKELLVLKSAGSAALHADENCLVFAKKGTLNVMAVKTLVVRSLKQDTIIKGKRVKINCL